MQLPGEFLIQSFWMLNIRLHLLLYLLQLRLVALDLFLWELGLISINCALGWVRTFGLTLHAQSVLNIETSFSYVGASSGVRLARMPFSSNR